MKLQSLMFLLIVLLGFVAAREHWGPRVGGWSPIEDINDPYVTDIANYAVTEYDKRNGAGLKFEKVIKGESQVVAGMNYNLTLSATDGSISNNYEAIVWDKIWEHFRNLTSFEIVHV